MPAKFAAEAAPTLFMRLPWRVTPPACNRREGVPSPGFGGACCFLWEA